MKKKIFLSFTALVIFIMSVSIFAACDKTVPNDTEYWFSSYNKEFVKYDESTNNLDQAGTYWTMVVKNDCNVTIAFRNGTTDMFTGSATAFYINDKQVQSEVSDFYEYEYKGLKLKKGDTIKIHAFSGNSLATQTEAVNMQMFVVTDNTGTYQIDDIK